MLRAAIQRPVAVSMLFAALLLIGVLSYQRLAVDLLPSITYPRLTVMTVYANIPAEDLERLVTQRIEEVVTALTGVRSVRSRTREGISILTVEYEWGTQMDFANLHLREAVDRVAFRDDFPEEADRPVILRWDPTSRPVSILVLEGEGRTEALTEFAREVVKPALEQVDGISRAEVVGGADREILVQPDARKMAIYGIDMEDIRQALMRSNISFPGGKVRQGPLHLSLRIDGEYEDLAQIGSTDIMRAGRIADPYLGRGTRAGHDQGAGGDHAQGRGTGRLDADLQGTGGQHADRLRGGRRGAGCGRRRLRRLRVRLRLPRCRVRAGFLRGIEAIADRGRGTGDPGAVPVPARPAQPARRRPGHPGLHRDHLRTALLRRREAQPDEPRRVVAGRRDARGQLDRRPGEHQSAPLEAPKQPADTPGAEPSGQGLRGAAGSWREAAHEGDRGRWPDP